MNFRTAVDIDKDESSFAKLLAPISPLTPSSGIVPVRWDSVRRRSTGFLNISYRELDGLDLSYWATVISVPSAAKRVLRMVDGSRSP